MRESLQWFLHFTVAQPIIGWLHLFSDVAARCNRPALARRLFDTAARVHDDSMPEH